jgi:hypothetical protein
MTNHELVMAAMRSDPGREYTAGEIAAQIWGQEHRLARGGRVARILRVASKYGFVECLGTNKAGILVWRLAE